MRMWIRAGKLAEPRPGVYKPMFDEYTGHLIWYMNGQMLEWRHTQTHSRNSPLDVTKLALQNSMGSHAIQVGLADTVLVCWSPPAPPSHPPMMMSSGLVLPSQIRVRETVEANKRMVFMDNRVIEVVLARQMTSDELEAAVRNKQTLSLEKSKADSTWGGGGWTAR